MDLAKIRKKARQTATSEQPRPKKRRTGASKAPSGKQPEKAVKSRRKSSSDSPGGEKGLPLSAAAGLPGAESRDILNEGLPEERGPTGVQADAQARDSGERLLIFSLGKEKYAIPIHEIALIIEEPLITPVPNAPAYLRGIISLRGKVVSVLDVAARLQTSRNTSADGRKIIVLDMGADHFGLLVDAIDQLVAVDLQSLEPPPEGFKPVAQDFVAGVFHHTGQAIAFLNLPLFLDIQL